MLWWAAFLFLFCSSPRRWHCFLMANDADAKFVFDEYGWIERNFVPISQGVAAFKAHRVKPAAAVEAFQLCFSSDTESARQTHFKLLGEEMVWRPVLEGVALIDRGQ